MLRFGKITEFDPAKMYARVKFTDDEIVSAPLQILVQGAISNKYFFALEINEQVACMMDENSEQGVILGAVYNDKTNPVDGTPNIARVKFSDNSFIEYNRESHEFNANIQGAINIIASGDVSVEAESVFVDATVVDVDAENVNVSASNIAIDGEVSITGNVSIEGNLDVSENIASGATISAAVAISAPSISGPGVSMSAGNIIASGIVEGSQVKEGTIRLGTHKHTGVTVGGGTSGGPTP